MMPRPSKKTQPPPGVGDGAGQAAKSPTAWRAGLDLLGVLAGALLIALLIKAYILDVYLIPSGSMETALHGRPDGGDRILCSKLHYRFVAPERWEVAVFEFPYEAARSNRPNDYRMNEAAEAYRGQNFVKRIVGLPGETLAIAKGDIWVKPDGGAGYSRVVKPDSVQRGMWLNVYEEDFADLDPADLELFWKLSGDGTVEIQRGKGEATLSSGGGVVRMDYQPRIPAGRRRGSLAELPGVPDRYTLEQPVQFRCRNVLPDGNPCGHVYVKTFRTHNIAARCPACGSMQNEISAIYYHRRSGLAANGPYAVDPGYARQGEGSVRTADYHIVPDLRTVVDLAFADGESWYGVTILEDDRRVQAVFFADGRVELRVNGAASRPDHRAIAHLGPTGMHRIEFYVVDGVARVFVDSESRALLDVEVWRDRQPGPRALPRTSGVSLATGGGGVTLGRVAVDRDVFYYNGLEKPQRDEEFPKLGPRGDIPIDAESFFPMGDHCPSSYDARSWGPVPLANLKGPALFIWWPPDRIGKIAAP